MFITLVCPDCCTDTGLYRPGRAFALKKDHDNLYDDEAIAVYTPKGVKAGYVANSVGTVARGTHSAGYIYPSFEEEAQCIVRFVTAECAVAELVDKKKES